MNAPATAAALRGGNEPMATSEPPAVPYLYDVPHLEIMGAAAEVAARVRRELSAYFADPDGRQAAAIAQQVERFAAARQAPLVVLAVTETAHQALLPDFGQPAQTHYFHSGETAAGTLAISLCALEHIDRPTQFDLILRRLHVIMGQLENIDRTGVLQVLGDQRAKLGGLIAAMHGHKTALAKQLEEAKKNPGAVKPQALAKTLNAMQAGLTAIAKVPGLPPAHKHALHQMIRQLRELPRTLPVLARALPYLDTKLFPPGNTHPAVLPRQTHPSERRPSNSEAASRPIPLRTAHAAPPQKLAPAMLAKTGIKADAPSRVSMIGKSAWAERLAGKFSETRRHVSQQPLASTRYHLRVIPGNPAALRGSTPETRAPFSIVRAQPAQKSQGIPASTAAATAASIIPATPVQTVIRPSTKAAPANNVPPAIVTLPAAAAAAPSLSAGVPGAGRTATHALPSSAPSVPAALPVTAVGHSKPVAPSIHHSDTKEMIAPAAHLPAAVLPSKGENKTAATYMVIGMPPAMAAPQTRASEPRVTLPVISPAMIMASSFAAPPAAQKPEAVMKTVTQATAVAQNNVAAHIATPPTSAAAPALAAPPPLMAQIKPILAHYREAAQQTTRHVLDQAGSYVRHAQQAAAGMIDAARQNAATGLAGIRINVERLGTQVDRVAENSYKAAADALCKIKCALLKRPCTQCDDRNKSNNTAMLTAMKGINNG